MSHYDWIWLVASIGVSLSIVSLIAWRVRRKKRIFSTLRTLATEFAPPIPPQEIYSDADGFALLGPDWRWLRNVPVNYGCPGCEEWIATNTRDYLHVPSGFTFSIVRHKCRPNMETVPLEIVRRQAL